MSEDNPNHFVEDDVLDEKYNPTVEQKVFNRIWKLIDECRSEEPVQIGNSIFIKKLKELEIEYQELNEAKRQLQN